MIIFYKQNRQYTMKIWNLFILFLFYFSCISETQIDVPPEPPGDKDKELTLQVVIPGVDSPKSYALTEEAENNITSIDVLAFAKDDSDQTKEIFMYRATTNTINSVNNNTKTFNVILKRLDKEVRLVVLANATGVLNSLGPSVLVEGGITKGELLDKLIYDIETLNLAEGFPMWGQAKTYINLNTSAKIELDKIYLLRAAARVDITNSLKDTDFKIETVYVYNANKKAFIAPPIENLTVDETTKVTKTNIPTVDQSIYNFNKIIPQGESDLICDIYISENDKNSATNLNPTFIVLEAKYKNNFTPTFYRLDFIKDNKYIDIFRNHKYIIEILNVNSSGFSSLYDAVNSDTPSTGLYINISVDSKHSPIHDMVYNNQYMLGVGTSEVLFDWDKLWIGKSSGDNEFYNLRVLTTYSGGWSATENTDWFDIDIPQERDAIYITVNNNNTTGNEREGIITLTAGDLSMEVKVRQSGGANCHLIRFTQGQSKGSVKLPLSFAEYAKGSLTTTDLRAKVIWQEVTGTSPVNFSAILKGTGGSIKDQYIEVTATANGSYCGNAVIALVTGDGIGMIGGKVDEEILWSWHVWCMSENENVDKEFHNPNKDDFMPSIIGKYSTNEGLFYQWGRKDPFPAQLNYIQPRVIKREAVTSSNTLVFITQNPTTFYYKGNGYQDWLATGMSNEFWKKDKKEHRYDPCPTGWRVPTDNSDNSKWSLSPQEAGNFMNGQLKNSNGEWDNIGNEIWLSNKLGVNYPTWQINSSGSISNGNGESTIGNNVRCIKDIQLVKGL